jgi:hypothetical protein
MHSTGFSPARADRDSHSTIAAPDDSRAVAPVEMLTARNLGIRLARVASALKIVRATTTQRQVDAPSYITHGE